MKQDAKHFKRASRVDLTVLTDTAQQDASREATVAALSTAPYVSPKLFLLAARFVDPALLLLTSFFNAALHPGFAKVDHPMAFVATAVTAAIGLAFLFEAVGLYRFNVLLAPINKLSLILGSWFVLFGVVFSGVFIFKAGEFVSRIWLLGLAADGLLLTLVGRFLMAAFLRKFNKDGRLNRRAVLVGGGEPATRVMAVLEESHDTGVSLIGVFDDRGIERVGQSTHGLPRLGTVDDLIDFVRATRIDTLIITLPVPAEERLLHILNRLWVLPVDIRLSANGQKLHYRPRAYSYIGNLPCLDVFDKPLGEWGPFLKSLTDRVIASAAIVLLLPVMAVVALAIKMESKGSVIFKQKRFGFNNELIEIYKFRSMYTDRADADASKLVTKQDSRVTKVGRFIRKSSLDELPQLFNVLKGNLSLVGPRPHPTKAKAGEALYENVVDSYFARHKVKPGITGWAQINGWRGETDTAEKIERRVEHDLYYIDNWSLTLDLYILARTPLALLNTDNAF